MACASSTSRSQLTATRHTSQGEDSGIILVDTCTTPRFVLPHVPLHTQMLHQPAVIIIVDIKMLALPCRKGWQLFFRLLMEPSMEPHHMECLP